MARYIFRRLLQAIPLLFITSVVIFVLLQSAGDPLATLGGRVPPRAEDRERLRRVMGLDQPIATQYLYWLIGNDWVMIDRDGDGEAETPGTRRGVLRGDFGLSSVTRQPAIQIVLNRLPNTLILMVSSEFLIIITALIVGVISAVRQYSLLDNVLTTISFIAFSMPIFLVAFGLMYIFAVKTREWGLPYFPTSGMFDPREGQTFVQVLWHLALPVFTIAIVSIAAYSRFVRSNMLEVINSDYIRTARAKGLHERRILYRHAFKNAALPLVTLIGLDIPFFLAGAIVTETIFAWPGMGRLFIDHLQRLDYSVLMAILMLITVAVIVFQLLTDLVYTWLDPRIRYT
ncbi:MAG: ABC transporter permease [Anaerolineae bacterium]|nr:ABC transporter permease [Anaerolineae bacterium]